MSLRAISARSLLSTFFVVATAACGSSATPSSATSSASTQPLLSSPPVAAGSAPSASSAAPPTAAPSEQGAAGAPAAVTLASSLGTVKSIEVVENDLGKGPSSFRSYSEPAEVEAILKAIGIDQAPTGVLRRCPDDISVRFLDDAGKEKGKLGLCGTLNAQDDLQGAEFAPANGDRGGVRLADAAALKKSLTKAPPGAPKREATPKK